MVIVSGPLLRHRTNAFPLDAVASAGPRHRARGLGPSPSHTPFTTAPSPSRPRTRRLYVSPPPRPRPARGGRRARARRPGAGGVDARAAPVDHPGDDGAHGAAGGDLLRAGPPRARALSRR